MDCYRNFLAGWIREVLVQSVTQVSQMAQRREVVIAKVIQSKYNDYVVM